GAYDRIMQRTGLRFYRVESDVGMMGGSGAHEYMAPCPAGEDEIALAPGYAANLEVALRSPEVSKVGDGYELRGEPLSVQPAIAASRGRRRSRPSTCTWSPSAARARPSGMPPSGCTRS